MNRVRDYAKRIEDRNESLHWAGPQQPGTVKTAENIIGLRFPLSYADFLLNFGAGGVEGDEISGLTEDNAFLHAPGNVCADTIRWRDEVGLPNHLIVVHSVEDDFAYCLDSSRPDSEGEYPVISFDPDLPHTKEPRIAYSSFGEFLVEYLRQHSERARLE